MELRENQGAPGRRRALTGILGAGAVSVTGALAPQDAAVAAPATAKDAATAGSTGLPVLAADADWASTLAETPQVQLAPGSTYTLKAAVQLPNDCLVVGNGATVTVSGDTAGALEVRGKKNVTLAGIRFLGQSGDPVGTAMKVPHVGVTVARSTDVRITDCDFANWRGAGIVVTGDASDDYYAYRIRIRSNAFDRCYFGISTTDRSEYSLISDNSFTYCRLALWNSSGNWTVNSNQAVGCYGVYYSIAATSPYGELSSDNWNHGSLVGNTFNHANGGTSVRWTGNAAFPVGGSAQDPGPGVVVKGVIPPVFSGNSLWYTDLTAENLQGSGWLLSGSALSDLTVSCKGDAPVHLLGAQGSKAPELTGNVKNLLASLQGS